MFDRARSGPWTDVYSLALVLLSLAIGQKIDMGETLVEADRTPSRRCGSRWGLPPALRPLLGKMLVADSRNRMRSMEDVLDAIEEAEGRHRLRCGRAAHRARRRPYTSRPPEPPSSAVEADRAARRFRLATSRIKPADGHTPAAIGAGAGAASSPPARASAACGCRLRRSLPTRLEDTARLGPALAVRHRRRLWRGGDRGARRLAVRPSDARRAAAIGRYQRCRRARHHHGQWPFPSPSPPSIRSRRVCAGSAAPGSRRATAPARSGSPARACRAGPSGGRWRRAARRQEPRSDGRHRGARAKSCCPQVIRPLRQEPRTGAAHGSTP